MTKKEQEGAEEEEEEDGAGEVGVVHDVLVDVGEGVEDGEGLVILVSAVRNGTSTSQHESSRLLPTASVGAFTPSSTNSGGSPSYPSVPNAASQPVLSPPCSPMRPLTPGALNPIAPPHSQKPGLAPPNPYAACDGVAWPDTGPGVYVDG
ncbi:putative Golgi membrane protein [Diplocarpon rosae]|nr:putative Golgi membrane protein [Diplocarpon rosae]